MPGASICCRWSCCCTSAPLMKPPEAHTCTGAACSGTGLLAGELGGQFELEQPADDRLLFCPEEATAADAAEAVAAAAAAEAVAAAAAAADAVPSGAGPPVPGASGTAYASHCTRYAAHSWDHTHRCEHCPGPRPPALQR